MNGAAGHIPDALRAWAEQAIATVTADELIDLTRRMVDIPSPTGDEQAFAEFAVAAMRQAGLDARYQPIVPGQGNAIGTLRGAGGGASLLIHGPLDTVFGGPEDEDVPFLGVPTRPDQVPRAHVDDGWITGAGAHNPKGHAACAITAAAALERAAAPLKGDLIVGLSAGGMPSNRRPRAASPHDGHGSGLRHMVAHGLRADFGLMAKPGPPSWEEVGLAWFRIRVNGLLGYAGTRHVVKHNNPILEATRLIAGLEAWFPAYTKRNSSGLAAPTGSIGAIRAGWPYKPTFIPQVAELFLDLRISPRTPPEDVRQQFAEAIARIAAEQNIDLDWEMIVAIPGTTTPRDNWIVGSAIRAYEAMTGKAYAPPAPGAGATEANVMRLLGIPTVRMGLPPPAKPGRYSGMFSTGEVHVESLMALTRGYIYAAVDTCLRPRAETGLV